MLRLTHVLALFATCFLVAFYFHSQLVQADMTGSTFRLTLREGIVGGFVGPTLK